LIAELHPQPELASDGASLDDRAAELAATADSLSDEQLLVELMRLLGARDRDGHTGVIPFAQTDVHAWPLALYDFEDGMFVMDALPPYEHLIGAELQSVGATGLSQVEDALRPLVSGDSEWTVRARLPAYLVIPEILEGLGLLSGDVPALTFRASDATEIAIDPTPIPIAEFSEWRGLFDPLVPPALPPADAAPHPPDGDEQFWSDVVRSALYVAYNRVQGTTRSGRSISDLATDIDEAVRSGRAERVVLDVRRNPGGNNGTYGPMLDVLERLSAEIPGSVVVLIGRSTFSAAGNFVTELRRAAGITLIGEPMGAAPNLYGDATVRTLPASGVVVHVATREWTFAPGDEELTVSPDVVVPVRWSDYARGEDLALDRALQGG
jgi:hypothetical protein